MKFYVGDAASKLLLVPVRGNAEAEKAASELGVPVGVVSVSWSDGAPLAWLCDRLQDSKEQEDHLLSQMNASYRRQMCGILGA